MASCEWVCLCFLCLTNTCAVPLHRDMFFSPLHLHQPITLTNHAPACALLAIDRVRQRRPARTDSENSDATMLGVVIAITGKSYVVRFETRQAGVGAASVFRDETVPRDNLVAIR